jgi:hypothetical protein
MAAKRTPLVVDGHLIPNVRVRETGDGLRFDAVVRLDGGRQTTHTLDATTVDEALYELNELGLLHVTPGLVQSIAAAVREVIREELESVALVELRDDLPRLDGRHSDRDAISELLRVGLEPAPPVTVRPPDPERDQRVQALREAFLRSKG